MFGTRGIGSISVILDVMSSGPKVIGLLMAIDSRLCGNDSRLLIEQFFNNDNFKMQGLDR